MSTAPVITIDGPSGSGKTSLVFDTLYHEARRRFLEIFSLGSTGLRLSPAHVRAITGLGPAMAVGQNAAPQEQQPHFRVGDAHDDFGDEIQELAEVERGAHSLRQGVERAQFGDVAA